MASPTRGNPLTPWWFERFVVFGLLIAYMDVVKLLHAKQNLGYTSILEGFGCRMCANNDSFVADYANFLVEWREDPMGVCVCVCLRNKHACYEEYYIACGFDVVLG